MTRTALVTGGARSIGAAITVKLAVDGYAVAVHARSERPAVHEFIASLPGGPHAAVFGDISLPEDAQAIVRQAIDRLGQLDLLVNNAGIHVASDLERDDFDLWRSQWSDQFATNVFGTANVTYAAVRHFLDRAAGPSGARIVNIGSRGAYRGEPDAPAYGASKAAVHSMTQSLAVALAPHGIAVAAVAPGFIATERTAGMLDSPAGERVREQSPFGRVGQPQEVASAVAWLASPDAVWASGAILDLNGASYLR
jgi:3-oxoacyl-[acyl-carrier protein] reductase